MRLQPETISDFKRYAAMQFPDEACGVITGEGFFLPQDNLAEEKANDFVMNPRAMLDYDVAAIVHSHPLGNNYPSAADMRGQIETNVPWGLCVVNEDKSVTEPFFWGADEFIPPLVGREFRSGPSGSDGRGDCYALIRDWYKLERGITLMEHPRDYSTWNTGDGLYAEHYYETGFRDVAASDVRDGDMFLMRLNSPLLNHGGIVLDGGQVILHHLNERMSRREAMGRWVKFIERWMRYDG